MKKTKAYEIKKYDLVTYNQWTSADYVRRIQVSQALSKIEIETALFKDRYNRRWHGDYDWDERDSDQELCRTRVT